MVWAELLGVKIDGLEQTLIKKVRQEAIVFLVLFFY